MILLCNGSIIQKQVAGRHLSLTPGCVVSTSASRLASGEPLSAAALARKGSGFGGSHRQAMVAIQPRGMLGGSIPSPLVTPTVTLDDPSSAIIARGLPQLCRSCNPPSPRPQFSSDDHVPRLSSVHCISARWRQRPLYNQRMGGCDILTVTTTRPILATHIAPNKKAL